MRKTWPQMQTKRLRDVAVSSRFEVLTANDEAECEEADEEDMLDDDEEDYGSSFGDVASDALYNVVELAGNGVDGILEGVIDGLGGLFDLFL